MYTDLSPYKDSVEELSTNFTALLADFDYKDEIKLLDLSFFDFRRKKNMVKEFDALYIGLWSKALTQTLPAMRDLAFNYYCETELPKKYTKRTLVQQKAKISQYVEFIHQGAENDFSLICHHILSLLHFKEANQRNLNLRIALHIRTVYTFIVERLM